MFVELISPIAGSVVYERIVNLLAWPEASQYWTPRVTGSTRLTGQSTFSFDIAKGDARAFIEGAFGGQASAWHRIYGMLASMQASILSLVVLVAVADTASDISEVS